MDSSTRALAMLPHLNLQDFQSAWLAPSQFHSMEFLFPTPRPLLLGRKPRIPHSPPGNAGSARTHSQHQLLKVPGELASDASLNRLPCGLEVLIKHWPDTEMGDLRTSP